MDQEQLLALVRYLQSQGVPEKEITNMFGEYFGIEQEKPDYTGMFEKYMPTFAQIESIIYLRNQLLRDSDWASMHHGVELRTPFVDVSLLNNLKDVLFYLQFFKSKTPLISSLTKKELPKSIVVRKKIGFDVPVRQWILSSTKNKSKNSSWAVWMRIVSNIY